MLYNDEEICTDLEDNVSAFHGAAAPPVYQTSLFTFNTFKDFTEAQIKEREEFVYTRGVNPTVKILEEKLAKLERGESCKCFGSGMGAISAVFLSMLKSGDHVLFVNHIYGPTTQLMDVLTHFQITFNFVSNDLEEIKNAVQPNTKMVYVESPGTMLMNVVNLEKTALIAQEYGLISVIDNTWSTPIFQKPLTLGFDLSIHSLTKYIGGHSDVMGGAVIGSRKIIDHIFKVGFQLNGSVLSPNDAFLIIRGLRTLPLRLKQHQHNALRVIEFLQSKKEVSRIFHPSIETESKGFLQKQMSGFSGLLSFELSEGSFHSVSSFIDSLDVFKIGVSWGGFESLVNSPLKNGNEEELRKQGFPLGLIRLSVGLEGSDLQINDLEKAFHHYNNKGARLHE